MTAPAGVNVIGYLDAENGLGEVARGVVATLSAADIPFSTTTWTRTAARRAHDHERGDDAIYPVTIACINADRWGELVLDGGPRIDGPYRIAVWAWETEVFPRFMARLAATTDEIWALSEHSAAAIRRGTRVPTYVFAPPVLRTESVGHIATELPDGFVFLFSFDFLSIVERKNPTAIVDAFTRAFQPGEGPQLVLKSVNGDRRPRELAALQAAAADRADITVLDGYVPPHQHRAMIAGCDAYVSLHRAEGYGLTLAEAMAQGKPVIATDYSGNVDFMSDENSCLVPFAKIGIPDDAFPYQRGTPWADPDVAEAARFMRRLYEEPAWADALGARAQADIATFHSPAARVPFVRARVERAAALAPRRHRVPLFLRPEIERVKALGRPVLRVVRR